MGPQLMDVAPPFVEGKTKFPLADLITVLGREIREAQRRAQEDGLSDILELKECTAEIGVEWDYNVNGGIEFWVVKLGGEVTKQNTHTLNVTLNPIGDIVVDLTHQ